MGAECLTTENWRGGIPFIMVWVNEVAADATKDRAVYFLKPSVWADIQEVYDGYLVNFPEDLTRRSEYAKYSCQCAAGISRYNNFRS